MVIGRERPDVWTFLPKALSPFSSSLHREFTPSGWSALALWLFFNLKPEPENSGLRLPHLPLRKGSL